ncbi:hypothetical protein Asp14428_33480 [Actinoplanes sp. NBRC 14428]|nr:hypothetical protein Asp14428_33480 [Actinoplanes sp. NBRC 14428]
MSAAGEAADVTDVAEQTSRSCRAYAGEFLQGAAGCVHQLGEFGVGGLDLLVDDDEFVNQLGSQPAAGLADHVTRTHGVEQRACLLSAQELLGAARHQFEQQVMQSADGLGAGSTK